ncbi:Monocarboxylate transporter 9 [Eumeta japonica]|uniref:Monocarboxylate transporter 9 n=1 Tax=Eumeta variegata TaxID=151549 RepID=A0A4C1YTB9_EUMVA|nr:Monocarboxylate transporter 9 [Eumeta japonica]
MGVEKDALTAQKPVQNRVKLVPPDGGWGWFILIGTALSNIFNQSMLSLFSLLYGGALEEMGHQTKGAALVLSTMLFVTNFGGPIAAVLIKMTSTRFVAVSGACSCTLGIFLSGFSTNIWHLVFSYGFLLGLGLGFIQNSSFVAINSYFTSRKSRAVGLANVGTGVGQTLMPHVVGYLLNTYCFRGACLILAGLSLHGIAGTMLIQPVERHMKKIVEVVPVDEKLALLNGNNDADVKTKTAKEVTISHTRRATEPAVGNQKADLPKSYSYKELMEKDGDAEKDSKVITNGDSGTNSNAQNQKPGIFKKLYILFDFSLLTSPRFLNIIIGTALSVTSIQNFSMLFPLFLKNFVVVEMEEIATCMSVIAGADIVGRLVLPVFQDKFKIKARWMLIMTCIWLIVARQILAYQKSLMAIIVMSALYGFGRSMIIVARNIAISENCKMEQVPAAVGLGMLAMGIIVPPAGFFLGWIRDYTQSYIICITAQNALLVILLIFWIPDMLYLHYEERKQKRKELEDIQI